MKISVKIAGIAAAFALAITAAAPTAGAQTISELQALIAQLQSQITAMGTGTTASSYTYTRDLTLGSTGADVTALQTFLESKGFLTIPTGVSKGYFGALTASALAKYQASVGISPAVGYFGPITRAKVNGDTTTGGSTTGGSTSGTLNGGAGDITVSEKTSGIKDEVIEGAEEVKVLGFEVEAEGSDIMITSVKVELEQTDTTGSDKLNRYADEVQIMFGGKVVGTADVSDFTENSDVYSRSIPVKGLVIDEDEQEMIYVSITALDNVDSDDLGKNWEITLDQTRFEDATGAILTDSTSGIAETFTFEDLASTGDIELTVREDDETINDAHTVQVDDSSDTNDVEVLSFEIEADGSDLFLNSLVIYATSTGAGVTEIANDFRLMMDGEEVGTVTLASGFSSSTTATTSITISDLDDDDVMIDMGDTVTFTLEADINDIDGAFSNGDTLAFALDSGDVDAEDENGDDVTDLTGSAQSDAISFAANGVMLGKGSADTSSRIFNLDTTSSDDQGKFEVVFEVTAFDDTAFIALTGTSTNTAVAAAGAYAYVENVNANDVVISTGTTTVTLERVSGGSISGNYVKINAGDTAVLKATIYHDAATTGNYRAQLGKVNFAATEAVGTTAESAAPTSDYQTPSEQILN